MGQEALKLNNETQKFFKKQYICFKMKRGVFYTSFLVYRIRTRYGLAFKAWSSPRDASYVKSMKCFAYRKAGESASSEPYVVYTGCFSLGVKLTMSALLIIIGDRTIICYCVGGEFYEYYAEGEAGFFHTC